MVVGEEGVLCCQTQEQEGSSKPLFMQQTITNDVGVEM